MPDRWMDERERQWRERSWRSEAYGRGEERRDEPRRARDEDRSWRGPPDKDWGPGGARFEEDRDRVFGERDTGAEYNWPPPARSGGTAGGYGPGPAYGRADGAGRPSASSGHGHGRGGWQDREYEGVSPAMWQGEYELERQAHQSRFQTQDYTQGGRFYGDDRRMPIYREEYGQGGVEYGRVPGGFDAESENARLEQRYAREMRRPVSGGTGGYDYERGYGDAGRHEAERWRGGQRYRGREAGERPRHEGRGGYEARGGGAGDFLHRAGERLSSWLGGFAGERGYEGESPRRYSADFGREDRWVVGDGHRGRGPKDYRRSDDRISDEIHQRLTDDAWLDASHISVTVEKGEVTLSGHVENREAKRRAERLVEDVAGVEHVQNNLRVERSFFTSPESGYGDSVMEAQMRGEGGDGSAMSRSTTRRT